ncbi:hypothetical protein PoB_007052200 [Plakobranchus ocellatus]|uniref:Uncharacterized protein n=1 Tax=Plakobranchus ocellatus TaxID=259542 RepID=A0AAV4DJ10_9GAST|nr:hypothetical protein PoB_007052200 [Plakobranchus ocellatus]
MQVGKMKKEAEEQEREEKEEEEEQEEEEKKENEEADEEERQKRTNTPRKVLLVYLSPLVKELDFKIRDSLCLPLSL